MSDETDTIVEMGVRKIVAPKCICGGGPDCSHRDGKERYAPAPRRNEVPRSASTADDSDTTPEPVPVAHAKKGRNAFGAAISIIGVLLVAAIVAFVGTSSLGVTSRAAHTSVPMSVTADSLTTSRVAEMAAPITVTNKVSPVTVTANVPRMASIEENTPVKDVTPGLAEVMAHHTRVAPAQADEQLIAEAPGSAAPPAVPPSVPTDSGVPAPRADPIGGPATAPPAPVHLGDQEEEPPNAAAIVGFTILGIAGLLLALKARQVIQSLPPGALSGISISGLGPMGAFLALKAVVGRRHHTRLSDGDDVTHAPEDKQPVWPEAQPYEALGGTPVATVLGSGHGRPASVATVDMVQLQPEDNMQAMSTAIQPEDAGAGLASAMEPSFPMDTTASPKPSPTTTTTTTTSPARASHLASVNAAHARQYSASYLAAQNKALRVPVTWEGSRPRHDNPELDNAAGGAFGARTAAAMGLGSPQGTTKNWNGWNGPSGLTSPTGAMAVTSKGTPASAKGLTSPEPQVDRSTSVGHWGMRAEVKKQVTVKYMGDVTSGPGARAM